MPETPYLHVEQILRSLKRHGIKYILIGGVAALIHDLPVPATVDIDITPARDSKNLHRLSKFLEDVDAALWSADEGGTWFPRMPVEKWAQYDTLHLLTRLGPLDIVFFPDGAENGFIDLVDSSESAVFNGVPVMLVSVTQWRHLKESAARDKDYEHLRMVDESIDWNPN